MAPNDLGCGACRVADGWPVLIAHDAACPKPRAEEGFGVADVVHRFHAHVVTWECGHPRLCLLVGCDLDGDANLTVCLNDGFNACAQVVEVILAHAQRRPELYEAHPTTVDVAFQHGHFGFGVLNVGAGFASVRFRGLASLFGGAVLGALNHLACGLLAHELKANRRFGVHVNGRTPVECGPRDTRQ